MEVVIGSQYLGGLLGDVVVQTSWMGEGVKLWGDVGCYTVRGGSQAYEGSIFWY